MSARVATVNLDAFTVDLAVARLIPRDMAERLRALPVNRLNSALTVAMENPYDDAASPLAARQPPLTAGRMLISTRSPVSTVANPPV